MKHLFVAFAAVLCLAAPAAAQADFTATAIMLTVMSMNQPGPQPQTDPCTDCARIKKVAVLPALGTSVPFEGRGKNGDVDISAWNLDGKIAAALKKHLAGRFEVVDAAFDTKALAANVRSSQRLKAFLKTVANPGVDAYIVVRPVSGAPGTDGISFRALDDGVALVRPNYEIDIFDAKTQSRLGYADARFRQRENDNGFYPYVEADDIDKQAVIAGTAPDALERLHRAVTWALQSSAVETLRALDIGASLPPVGDRSIAVPWLTAEMAKFKTLGVVSVLGDGLQTVVGGHMFIARKNVAALGVFPGLDAEIEKLAGDVLARNHTVKPVTLDHAKLANVALPTYGKMAPIPDLPTSDEVDAYVLFVKAPVFDDDANQGGVLLLHWIPMGSSSLALVANVGIAVIDAKTGKVITSARLQPGPQFLCEPTEPATQGMSRCPLDEKKFTPVVPEQPSEATKAEVRARLAKILADGVPETLFKAGLDSPAP